MNLKVCLAELLLVCLYVCIYHVEKLVASFL